MTVKRLTPVQRQEAIRTLKAGGQVSTVAETLGATDGAIRQIKNRGIRSKDATTTEGRVVSVRLSPEEVQAFDALCGQMGGKNRSDGLRSIVRMSVGFLEMSKADSDTLDEIKRELHKIGINVNQIALAANRRQLALGRGQWDAVNNLVKALPQIRSHLAMVIDENRRRGVTLFKKFIEAEQHG